MSTIPCLLSAITFLPLVGAIIVMCLPRARDIVDADHEGGHEGSKLPDVNRQLINGISFCFAFGAFLLSILLFSRFDSSLFSESARNMQFTERFNWISIGSAHIQYHMGVDGVSLLLILLTTLLTLLCVIFSFNNKSRHKEFMIFLLLLETGMIGVFCALDLVLFYVFWEAMLIPMYFLIGIFGHERRVYAAIKFFLFTFAGSVLMLIAIVSVYRATGTFDVVELSTPTSAAARALGGLDFPALMWMFAAFSLAFMIKVPMFPFHTWLPDAHVEAPTAGSVILAGVMLKMGTYGFIRFCLPIFPEQAQAAAPVFIVLAIIGIIYGSIVAAVQPDAKKLVAYSSVAHLGFVILGIFTFTRVGMMGALVQNLNHGISTPMLFFIVGMLYERRHTRLISEYGGIKKVVPFMAAMLLIATLASVAVPFFNGFVGEFPILQGSFVSSNSGFWPTALAATGMILSAVYMLWWFQRLMLGPISNDHNRHLPDLTRSEWFVLAPLAVVVFWFGISSTFWTHRMDRTVDLIVPSHRERMDDSMPITDRLITESIGGRKEGAAASVDTGEGPMVVHPEMEPVLYKDIPQLPVRQYQRPQAAGPSGSFGASGGGSGTAPQNRPKRRIGKHGAEEGR